MVERGLVESRSLAQRLVMAGQVRVGGQVANRPALRIAINSDIIIDHGPRFVSRGGEKLEAALTSFGLTNLAGMICADVGASTGGFSDCLLQHDAQKVYAIDVGYGELHWKLRSNPRIIVMERINARRVQSLPEPINLATVDASFISLKVLLPVINQWLAQEGLVIALVKPQFEAGRVDAARGEGVIKDPAIHKRVLLEVTAFAESLGFSILGLITSPLLGPKGNREFLIYLSSSPGMLLNSAEMVDLVLG